MNMHHAVAEATTAEEFKGACFDELAQLMWAIERLSVCGQNFACLLDAEGTAYVNKRIRECLVQVEVYQREAANAAPR